MATHERRRGITALTVSSAKSLRRRLTGFLQSSSPFEEMVALPCLSNAARRLNAKVGGRWLAIAFPLGFVDIKVCAIDELWSGLKLVIRKELR